MPPFESSAHRAHQLAFDDIAVRSIDRATLLARVGHAGGETAVLLDAATDEFVRLSDAPPDVLRRYLSISPDGSQVVYRDRGIDDPHYTLVVFDLASRQERAFRTDEGRVDFGAALSPDSAKIATLTIGADRVTIDVIELSTAARRTIWSAEGFPLDEGALGWSPSGHLLAVSHLTLDEEPVTVVVESAGGSVQATIAGVGLLAGPNASWLNDDELVAADDESGEPIPPLHVVNLATGARRRIDRTPECVGGCFAVIEERLIQRLRDDFFVASALDGTDATPFLTIGAPKVLVNLIVPAPLAGRS